MPNTKKAFTRFVFAKADITAAKDLAQLLLGSFDLCHENSCFRAMETGIITSYSRPFGNNRGLGRLPPRYGRFPETESQIVHDGILKARNIQEAHNDLVDRGSLISAEHPPDAVSMVEIEVETSGRTWWGINRPFCPPALLERMIRLFDIQLASLRVEIEGMFAALLQQHNGEPGTFVLGRDFPRFDGIPGSDTP